MRILFITAFVPAKTTAGQNYTRQLIEDLAKYHEIHLIYWSPEQKKADVPSNVEILRSYNTPKVGFNIIKKLKYFPLFSKRFNKSVLKYIQSISQQYDCLYFDFSQVMLYSCYIDHPYKIGMSHDVIAQKYSRNKYAKYLSKWIQKTERKCLQSFKDVFTFSNKDAKYIKALYTIKPNVVSFYISPEINQIKLFSTIIEDYFVLYGAWNRPENQFTLHWLINHPIQKKIKIIGRGIPEELKSQLESNDNIECLGFVNNPYPLIASSKGLIAPLRSGVGVKVKAIESLSLGTPIIGTDVTFEGIDLPEYLRQKAFWNIDLKNYKDIINCLENISSTDKCYIQTEFIQYYKGQKLLTYLGT